MRELTDTSYPYTSRKTSFLKGFLGGHIGLRKYYEPRGYSKYTIFRGYIPFHNNFTYIVLYDKPREEGGKDIMANHVFNFYPLNNEHNSYIFEQPSDPKEDIFNTDVIKKYANMTDNNNGGMIIDVIQQYEEGKEGKLEPKYYGDCVKVRIGFVLGYEEEDFYSEKVSGHIPIERAFERLVSPYEYVKKTSYGDCYEVDLPFAKNFVSMCNFFGVEMKYSKKKALAIHKKERHIKSVVEALTKNLPEGKFIDVPKELLNLSKGYTYK